MSRKIKKALETNALPLIQLSKSGALITNQLLYQLGYTGIKSVVAQRFFKSNLLIIGVLANWLGAITFAQISSTALDETDCITAYKHCQAFFLNFQKIFFKD